MFHFVEHHGIEALVIYYVLSAILGTLPPLPASAGSWSRWAYGAAHALSGNLHSLAVAMKIQDDTKQ